MTVMEFRKPASQSDVGPEPAKHEAFGKWMVPINATWVLDFVAFDDRYVFTGSKRQMRDKFFEIFKHDLVYMINGKRPLTAWGGCWKINPISELMLLGFGPLVPGEERAKAITAAKRLKEYGPECVLELGSVIRQRMAREYDRLGLAAPVSGFWGYHSAEDDIWDSGTVPDWVKCSTFCRAAQGGGLNKMKVVN